MTEFFLKIFFFISNNKRVSSVNMLLFNNKKYQIGITNLNLSSNFIFILAGNC
jgi:hypothetical protein